MTQLKLLSILGTPLRQCCSAYISMRHCMKAAQLLANKSNSAITQAADPKPAASAATSVAAEANQLHCPGTTCRLDVYCSWCTSPVGLASSKQLSCICILRTAPVPLALQGRLHNLCTSGERQRRSSTRPRCNPQTRCLTPSIPRCLKPSKPRCRATWCTSRTGYS